MSDTTVDIIDELAGISPGTPLDELRRRRPVTRTQLQASHDALFAPLDDADFPLGERLLVAAFATRLTADDATAAHFADRAVLADPARASVVIAEAAQHAGHGPFGRYREEGLADESTDGPRYSADAVVVEALGAHLAAALEHTHLLVYRPREASGRGARPAGRCGLEHRRHRHALAAGGVPRLPAARRGRPSRPGCGGSGMSGAIADVRSYTYEVAYPDAFTRGEVGWVPWLEPFPLEELTERHHEGLVDRGRASSDYFRLLVRDPEILRARTLVDKDIFYNVAEGLPRAERELAAAAASRVNGCVFCASVHARFAAHHSQRPDLVDQLLDEGIAADLGRAMERHHGCRSRPHRDAARVRPPARRAAARGRARRPRDRRRHPRGGVLQLGEPAHALAGPPGRSRRRAVTPDAGRRRRAPLGIRRERCDVRFRSVTSGVAAPAVDRSSRRSVGA